ncbi:hypothetical protein EYF80_061803 [Liparis tanakae]|uniref:Uncharacterized protein n=1 Tax=Liparis tanakae TaxID=230148 RepID=A0A4Z2EGP3_9TELE|nr:hypothetical protein EYF80_061803 [Liparis tanakae]
MPRLNEACCGCQARCRQRASISCEISCELTSRKSHIWLESQKLTTLKHPGAKRTGKKVHTSPPPTYPPLSRSVADGEPAGPERREEPLLRQRVDQPARNVASDAQVHTTSVCGVVFEKRTSNTTRAFNTVTYLL